MSLSKDILGQAIYDKLQGLNDQTIDPSQMEAKRLEFCKEIADAVIEHFKAAGEVNVLALGLVSPSGPVTGTAKGTIA